LSFYALTFAISWSSVLLVIGGPGAIPGNPEQVESRMLYAVLALFAGPSIAGLVMTGVVHGRAGYRDLLSRLVKWRVGVGWYAAALLTAPVVFIGIGLVAPSYHPSLFVTSDKSVLLLLGLIAALMSLLEEIGWTGFATPEIRRRFGVLTTGLIVGGLWGLWHSVLNAWSNGGAFGALPFTTFLILYVLVIGIPHLTAYRVLIVWVYDRTGSLFLAWLMHASFAASTFALGPLPLAGADFLTWFLTVTLAFWLLVGAVAVASRKRPSPQDVVQTDTVHAGAVASC
jgi:membrane protease YdiL (CAAX protease family)